MTENPDRKLIAEACDDILTVGKKKRYWRKLRAIALNASDEEFNEFMQYTLNRKDCFEILFRLSVQMNFIVNLEKAISPRAEKENDCV